MPPSTPAVPERSDQHRPFGAVVLAGSHGWAGAHAPVLPPRPLAQVALRPLISYALDWISEAGAAGATICANGSSGLLRGALGDWYAGLSLTYQQDRWPRGSAGCVRDASEQIAHRQILVVEGTLVPQLDLRALVDAHAASGAAMTVVTSDGGPALPPRAAGIYVVERSALERIPAHGYHDIKENVIPALHAAGQRVLGYRLRGECRAVATLDSYLDVNFWLVERLQSAGNLPAGIERVRPDGVIGHSSAIVDPEALCVGPVLVGKRARVQAGATIVGPAVIGEGSDIEPGALVSRSVIGRSCGIGSNAVVHGCMVGDGSKIEAGANLCHALRLPKPSRWRWLAPAIAARRRARRPDRRRDSPVPVPIGSAASVATRRAVS
ncbi:MAG: NDP-sugar synthase [Acidobacteria bacterium]|nr:NDP-sugar synthase [Acidobacteriota bacterium]